MTASTLLDRLKAYGVKVAVNGDRLKLAAPPGVLEPRMLDLVAQHKAELLQLLELEHRELEYSTPADVPPADGLQRRYGFIKPTHDTMPAYRVHWEAKQRDKSTPPPGGNNRQTERIQRLAAETTPEELREAYKRIKPMLKNSLSKDDLHELALTLAHADRHEKANPKKAQAPREVLTRDLYSPDDFDSENA